MIRVGGGSLPGSRSSEGRMEDNLPEEEAKLGDANDAAVETENSTGQPSARSVAPAAIGNSSSSEEEEISSPSLKRKHEGGGAAESVLSTPNGKQKRTRRSSEEVIVIDGDEVGESSGAARSRALTPRMTGAFEPPDTAEHQSCIEVIKTLRTEVNTLRRKLEEVRDGIPLCPICLEGVTFPVSLCCGHLFCCACIYRVVMHSASRPQQRATLCPTCRGPISAAPRAPPLAFLQHLARLRALYTETQGAAGGGGGAADSPESGSSGQAEKADPTSYQLQMAELRTIFAPPAYEGAAVAQYDASDDVYRCPMCHWEVVDGTCVGCEWTAEQGEAAEEEEQEGDEEEEEEEEEEGEEGEEGEQGGYAVRVGADENFGGYGSVAEEEGEEEEEDDEEEGEEEGEEEEEEEEGEEDFGGGMLSRGRAGDYGGAYEEEEEELGEEEVDFVEVVEEEYADDEYALREEGEDYGDEYEDE